MTEIFKIYLSIWIVTTVVTIIPNTLLLIKIIKGEVKDTSVPEFMCAFSWFITSFAMGCLTVYKFL